MEGLHDGLTEAVDNGMNKFGETWLVEIVPAWSFESGIAGLFTGIATGLEGFRLQDDIDPACPTKAILETRPRHQA